MMRIRGVWTVNAAAFLVGAGMYSSFILIPEFAETPASAGYGFGASVTQAGLFLLPSTLAMLLVGPVAGRLAERVGSRVPLILGGTGDDALAFMLLAVAHAQQGDIYVALGAPRRRHRPRLRLARQPDRRGGPAAADRRRDRHEHGDADARRLGRRPDRRQRDRRHRRRRRRCRPRAASPSPSPSPRRLRRSPRSPALIVPKRPSRSRTAAMAMASD